MTDQRAPTFPAILNAIKASTMADLRVAIPARVERYDPGTQTIDAQPLVQDSYTDENGERVTENLPVVTSVPVIFPGGGGFRLVFPLQQGDTVLLVFNDRALDAWQSGGNLATPADDRRHELTDAVAIPGLHADNAAWSDAGEAVITIGRDGDNGDYAALSSKVRDEIQALRDTVNALVSTYNGHTHVVSGSVSGPSVSGTAAPTTAQGTAPAAVGDVASQTVKILG